jgi:hypothetical protein
MFRVFIIGILIFIHSTFALAQSEDSEEVTRTSASTHIGVLLPNQIEGVTEIMPMWGLRYTFPYRGKSLVEIGLANSQAEGVTINEGSIAFRGDFPIQDLKMIAYLGANVLYYAPENEDFTTDFGGFIGGGFLANISDALLFRTEMKFNVNPGTSLYIGFGFEVLFGEGGDDNDE